MRGKRRLKTWWVALATVGLVLASVVGLLYWHEHRPATKAKRLVALFSNRPPGSMETWMVRLKLAQPKPQLQPKEIEDQIVALGPDAFPAVASLLEEGDLDLATTGIRLLGRMRDPRAVEPLVAALDRPTESRPPSRQPSPIPPMSWPPGLWGSWGTCERSSP
jgi:hypothetical protein